MENEKIEEDFIKIEESRQRWRKEFEEKSKQVYEEQKAKQHQEKFKNEFISLSYEEQTALGRKLDKVNLKITIAEVLFGFSCLYLLSSSHEAYAVWMALWRIGFIMARK